MLLYYHRAKVQKLSHLCSAFKNNSYLYGMNDIELIQNKIYEIRGQRVMLDFDLAQAYGVDTAQLKRQVRRNMERFEGEYFMFELTQEELSRCQIGIMNKGRGYNIKYLPFAFTELGVAMLSSVLRSPSAIKINRGIMRAFVAVRQSLPTLMMPSKLQELEKGLKELRQEVEDILSDQNEINEDTRAQLDAISTALVELQTERSQKQRRPIGFNAPQD